MASLTNQLFGLPMLTNTGSVSFNNHTLDATTDGMGVVFQAEDTNAITHLGFRYGARTGTPPTYVITLEGVSATTGQPDGTDVGGGSPTAATFTPPADATWDGTWQWVALTNSYTPTRGQFLAMTVRYSSGTVDASNLSTFTTDASGVINAVTSLPPYATRLTAGSWAARSPQPIYGVRTASTRYGAVIQSVYSTQTASTVGHRIAMKFTTPSGSGTTFKVKGFNVSAQIANAVGGKNPIAGLWSDGGVIQNVTLDSDIVSSIAQNRFGTVIFDESSLTALSVGTDYYIGFEVADATNGQLRLFGSQCTAGDLAAYPGGPTWCLSTYNGSSWSDDTTVRPMVGLILDDMTCSGGSGGAVIGGPNLRAGMMA